MLHVIFGTDRKQARAALQKVTGRSALRITDASSVGDLQAALGTSVSMFGDKSTIIFDGVCGNEEMRVLLVNALPSLAQAQEEFFIVEQKPDAALKKQLQKYAEKVEIFDAQKSARGGSALGGEYPTVFKLADHLKKGDKKNMWVAYQRELAQGNAPEAIHGVLFWGAKQHLLAARGEKDSIRGRALVARLAALPHEARRHGEELEYALERFILSAV